MRTFGAVKMSARPVPKEQPGAGPAFVHPLLPMEAFDTPMAVPAIKEVKSPFAFWRDRPTPQFLDYAAFYVAGVLCERHGHVHPLGQWPCKQMIDFAYTEVHLLAAQKLPHCIQEQGYAKGKKKSRQSTGKSGKKSTNGSRRKSKRGPAGTGHHVRRKR